MIARTTILASSFSVLVAALAVCKSTSADDLSRGQRAIVVGYSEAVEPSIARRLFDLGLVPGIEVEMVRRAPMRDPVIYRVGDYEIALRAAQSRCIHVEPVR